MFGFGRKKKAKGEANPLAAFDGLLEDLERQAAEIRKSAATLLSLRGELSRDVERYRKKGADLEGRLARARTGQDERAARVLERDGVECAKLLETSQQALADADSDGQLLLEAARDLSERIAELRTERTSARARLSVGLAVSGALKERSEKIDKVLALDAARDEVERAHALAEIYREDLAGKG